MSLRLPTLLAVLCLSVGLFLAPALAYDSEEDSSSYTLTELDFNQAVKEFDYLLVNFHALWCRYSKKLKPEWVALSKALKDDTSYQVSLAKVEAYDEKKLAEQYGVEGYPTIKLFIKGVPHDYTGERLKDNILEFVDRKLKRDVKIVDSVDAVKKYLEQYEWVGIFAGTGAQDIIKDVAFNTGDVLFVTTTNAEVKTAYKLADGQFSLVNNISGDSDVLDASFNVDSLTKFISDKKFPSIAKFSKGTAERVFLSEEPSLLLFRKTGQEGDDAEKTFTEAAGKLDATLFKSIVNYEAEIGKLLADNLGVEESELPTVRIVRADKERIRKYKLEGAITADSINDFCKAYQGKTAKRFYLSEPVPEQKDLVIKVVNKNFNEIVLDDNKDVLLHIWAPWCGHCRAMMPVYDNVARKTREVPDFIVAKVDASVNDLEEFGLDIVEYPTILLFKKGDKQNPIEFKDERNEYKFDDFIRANAAVNLDRMKGPNPFDRNEL